MKTMKRIPKQYILLVLVLILGLLVACGGGAEEATTPEAEPATAVSEETALSEETATAEPVTEETDKEDRTGMVKVLTYDADGERTAVDGLDGMDDYFANAIINDDFTVTTDTGVFELPEEIVKVCLGTIPATSLTCMDRPEEPVVAVATYTPPTATPEGEFECYLEAYESCLAVGSVEVPEDADQSITGATLFTFDTVGNQVEVGFMAEGTELPLYWQAEGYIATYDGVCKVWVSEDYINFTGELPTPINMSDWSADSECGGGSPQETPATGGGVTPVLVMTEGSSAEHGWVITITLQSGDVSGLTFGIEDIPIGPASEVLPFIIYDGLVLPSGRVINAGESLGAKLYPVASFAEGQYAELDANGEIIHGPAFFVKP